uniref:Putative secreted protein n=1 Tax=Amblyomma parvum TaxID=251391 RepID=A0A023FVQ9_AMBPA
MYCQAVTFLSLVLLGIFKEAWSVPENGNLEQRPIDPITGKVITFKRGSVKAGGYCRSSVQCEWGYCCLRWQCRKRRSIGQTCSLGGPVKGEVYHDRCPCLENLRCFGHRHRRFCVSRRP